MYKSDQVQKITQLLPTELLTTFLAMIATTTKVALVTGAARGIGRAVALRLAADGFDVAVNDLPNSPELDGLVREIEKTGRRSFAVPADVSLEPEVVKMIQDVVRKLGSLDVVSLSKVFCGLYARAYTL